MRAVTSRNTPVDGAHAEAIEHMWEDHPLPDGAGDGGPDEHIDLDGRIHLQSPTGDIDLIGQGRVLRIEINGGADMEAVGRFLARFADSSSPLWPVAQALSIAVDVAVDGARLAFYDASSADLDAAPEQSPGPDRPGTDRRLDDDEPYGNWTHFDDGGFTPPHERPTPDSAS